MHPTLTVKDLVRCLTQAPTGALVCAEIEALDATASAPVYLAQVEYALVVRDTPLLRVYADDEGSSDKEFSAHELVGKLADVASHLAVELTILGGVEEDTSGPLNHVRLERSLSESGQPDRLVLVSW